MRTNTCGLTFRGDAPQPQLKVSFPFPNRSNELRFGRGAEYTPEQPLYASTVYTLVNDRIIPDCDTSENQPTAENAQRGPSYIRPRLFREPLSVLTNTFVVLLRYMFARRTNMNPGKFYAGKRGVIRLRMLQPIVR